MAVRQYSDEFKKNALHLLEPSGKRLTEIERELGPKVEKLSLAATLLRGD
jgi:transposase-like protein